MINRRVIIWMLHLWAPAYFTCDGSQLEIKIHPTDCDHTHSPLERKSMFVLLYFHLQNSLSLAGRPRSGLSTVISFWLARKEVVALGDLPHRWIYLPISSALQQKEGGAGLSPVFLCAAVVALGDGGNTLAEQHGGNFPSRTLCCRSWPTSEPPHPDTALASVKSTEKWL